MCSMKVLIGTTNPSKVKRFKELLKDYNVEFLTLKDLNIEDEPNEIGTNPEENAIIKTKFYSKYFDVVVCNDSGLYFNELSLEDSRQPGLNIRTPNGCNRLNDEEMISYYANLIKSLGGMVTAYYLDGIAVYNNGMFHSFMDIDANVKTDSFYMIDKPSIKRHAGWPLDSLSVNKNSGKYFVDDSISESKDNIFINDYKIKITSFLKKALNIK